MRVWGKAQNPGIGDGGTGEKLFRCGVVLVPIPAGLSRLDRPFSRTASRSQSFGRRVSLAAHRLARPRQVEPIEQFRSRGSRHTVGRHRLFRKVDLPHQSLEPNIRTQVFEAWIHLH